MGEEWPIKYFGEVIVKFQVFFLRQDIKNDAPSVPKTAG